MEALLAILGVLFLVGMAMVQLAALMVLGFVIIWIIARVADVVLWFFDLL